MLDLGLVAKISRALARLKVMLAVLPCGMLLGCVSYPAASARLFSQEQPPLHLAGRGDHIRFAEKRAGESPRSFVMIGAGRSMEPAYPPGTALVVEERGFRSLRPGMCVVYRNTEGFYVAHVIVERLPRGWIAIGLNSKEPDDDFVTSINFVGVITAAFIPHG